LVIVIVGAYPSFRIWHSYTQVASVAEIDLPLIEILTNIEIHQLEQSITFERTIRYAQTSSSDILVDENDTSAYTYKNSLIRFRELSNQVGFELIKGRNTILKAIKISNNPDQLQELEFLLSSLEELDDKHRDFEKHALAIFDRLIKEDFDSNIYRLAEAVEREEDSFNAQIESVLLHFEYFTENQLKLIEKEERISLRTVETIAIIGVTLAFILLYFNHVSTLKQMDHLINYILELTQGESHETQEINKKSKAFKVKQAVEKLAFKSYTSKKEKIQLEKIVDQHAAKAYETIFELKKNLEELFKSRLSLNGDVRKLLVQYSNYLERLKHEMDLLANSQVEAERENQK
jgi:hypothetical protein